MHIIHGSLRKLPFIKTGCGQDQQSTMFAVELSEVIKDNRTGEKSYTNYSALIFAKSPAQIDYYNSVLVENNYIVVTGEKLKIVVSECGKYTKLQVENARLEGANYIEPKQNFAPQNQQAQKQQYQAPQQQYQQRSNVAPQQANNHQPAQGFDQEVPF